MGLVSTPTFSPIPRADTQLMATSGAECFNRNLTALGSGVSSMSMSTSPVLACQSMCWAFLYPAGQHRPRQRGPWLAVDGRGLNTPPKLTPGSLSLSRLGSVAARTAWVRWVRIWSLRRIHPSWSSVTLPRR